MTETTIDEFRKQVQGMPLGAGVEYLLAQDHATRVSAVQKAVDFACNLLEQYKQKKQDSDEDAITVEVCAMLTMSGIQAVHGAAIGGHCDVVVFGKDSFLWLAEAKEHSSYGWLDKGFQQLSTRYSMGTHGRDHGEVLIYCYTQDAKTMLEKWRGELEARNLGVKTSKSDCGNTLAFKSVHKHASTGLDFHVRHKAISLHWSPQDKH